eukprot:s1613_g13.t1
MGSTPITRRRSHRMMKLTRPSHRKSGTQIATKIRMSHRRGGAQIATKTRIHRKGGTQIATKTRPDDASERWAPDPREKEACAAISFSIKFVDCRAGSIGMDPSEGWDPDCHENQDELSEGCAPDPHENEDEPSEGRDPDRNDNEVEPSDWCEDEQTEADEATKPWDEWEEHDGKDEGDERDELHAGVDEATKLWDEWHQHAADKEATMPPDEGDEQQAEEEATKPPEDEQPAEEEEAQMEDWGHHDAHGYEAWSPSEEWHAKVAVHECVVVSDDEKVAGAYDWSDGQPRLHWENASWPQEASSSHEWTGVHGAEDGAHPSAS